MAITPGRTTPTLGGLLIQKYLPSEACGWKTPTPTGRLPAHRSWWWSFPWHLPWPSLWVWTGWERREVGKCAGQPGRWQDWPGRAQCGPGCRWEEAWESEQRHHRWLSDFTILLRTGPLPRDAEGTALPISLRHRQGDPLSKSPISW